MLAAAVVEKTDVGVAHDAVELGREAVHGHVHDAPAARDIGADRLLDGAAGAAATTSRGCAGARPSAATS